MCRNRTDLNDTVCHSGPEIGGIQKPLLTRSNLAHFVMNFDITKYHLKSKPED